MQVHDNFSRSRAPMRMRQARRLYRLAKKEGSQHKSLRAFIRSTLKDAYAQGKLAALLAQ